MIENPSPNFEAGNVKRAGSFRLACLGGNDPDLNISMT
jgi:hypothetical protein